MNKNAKNVIILMLIDTMITQIIFMQKSFRDQWNKTGPPDHGCSIMVDPKITYNTGDFKWVFGAPLLDKSINVPFNCSETEKYT